ncbi:polysaccharide deacetylase family protein [Cohnella sp.]|uniref:polysaccharide deacetylase family protein n=1 Tax=Cohnella sp. TaxID=1883426 RepID=UPI002580339F|nr:polysaccharide deacetylase family protein [Cohnella sp.]
MFKRLWGRCAAVVLCAVLLLSAGVRTASGHGSQDASFRDSSSEARTAIRNADQPGTSWTDMQRRYRGAFFLSAPGRPRQVALTFDDVPDPRFTPQVLDILKRKQVRATFFVVGEKALKHPDLVRRIRREGHAIGNHSFDHPNFARMSTAEVRRQIRRTEAVIRRQVGFAPRLIRPPYGEIREPQLKWAKSEGYAVVNWNVDSLDWRQLGAQAVFRNVTTAVRPGSIILLHAGGGVGQNLCGTIEALPVLIDWLRSKGYEMVALPQMLGKSERKA